MTKQPSEMQIAYCEQCNQMTNHREGVCLKHDQPIITDQENDVIVSAILDIIDKEHSRYKVAVAVAEWHDSIVAERVQEAQIQTLKSLTYTELDDLMGTEIILRSSIENKIAKMEEENK